MNASLADSYYASGRYDLPGRALVSEIGFWTMTAGGTLAIGQRSLGDTGIGYPLWPPLVNGCPRTSTAGMPYPVEVDYAYDQVQADSFGAALASAPSRGTDRWAPLLPPLLAPGLGEGGTPLVEIESGIFIKLDL